MFLAYYNHISIISVVIILLFLLFTFLGYKHGFMQKFLSIANGVCGFAFSVLFCGKFSNIFTYKLFGDKFSEKFLANIQNSDTYLKFKSSETSAEFLEELGVPSFISKLISSELPVDKAAQSLADTLSKFVCILISFVILFIGTTILIFVLKLLVGILRKAILIRIVDGILGIIFYDILFYLFVCVVFLVLSLVMQTSSFDSLNNFISNDFQLGTDSFRLSKYLYENNLIGNFFRIFF